VLFCESQGKNYIYVDVDHPRVLAHHHKILGLERTMFQYQTILMSFNTFLYSREI
jgi:hypothetical protein